MTRGTIELLIVMNDGRKLLRYIPDMPAFAFGLYLESFVQSDPNIDGVVSRPVILPYVRREDCDGTSFSIAESN